MSGIWKVLGALSAIVLVIAIAIGAPLPFWNFAILLFSITNGIRAWIRDAGRAANRHDWDVGIYGQDENGRPKAPTYHQY